MDNIFEQDKNFLYGVNDNYNDTGCNETGICNNCYEITISENLVKMPDDDIYFCKDCILYADFENSFGAETESNKEMIMKMRIDEDINFEYRNYRKNILKSKVLI